MQQVQERLKESTVKLQITKIIKNTDINYYNEYPFDYTVHYDYLTVATYLVAYMFSLISCSITIMWSIHIFMAPEYSKTKLQIQCLKQNI